MSGPVITFWQNYLETKSGSEWRTESWDAVFKRLSEPKPFRGDREHPGWSAARFEPCERALANVRQVFALCLDYDNKGKNGAIVPECITVERAADIWSDCYGLIHTSRSHDRVWPRFRVVLPFSRPVSPFEYSALWSRLKARAGHVDEAPKDPSRFWYLPGVRPDGEFQSVRLDGLPLDVDALLAMPDPTVTQPRQQGRRRNADPMSAEERAVRYIGKMPEAISGAGGHKATIRVAVVLVRGFDLSDSVALSILRHEYNPRCQPEWSEKELVHKVNQARKNGRMEFGALLNEEREGRRVEDAELDVDDEEEWVSEPPSEDPGREPGDDTEEIIAEREQPKRAVDRYRVHTERQLAVEVWKDATCGQPARGFTTGVVELDELMCGLRPDHIALVAAMTSWGKSTFASMVTTENRKAGTKVMVVSNEDKSLMYGRRMMCSRLEINAMRLRDRELTPKEIGVLGEFATSAAEDYVFLDAVGMPVEDVAKAIRELCAECGFQLVICDYLQRFRAAKPMDRRNEVTYAMGLLTDEIKNARAAGIVMSQLKRTDGKPPTMNDVKESGDVENMAEHVLIGWREIEKRHMEPDVTHRRINLPKNKDGVASEDWMELRFDDLRARFVPGHVVDQDGSLAAKESIRSFDDYGEDGRYP